MATLEFNNNPEQQAILSAMRLAAAKYQLHELSVEDMGKLAHNVLDAGIYTDSLRELAVDSWILPDWHSSVNQAFVDLSIVIPDEEEAIQIVIRHFLTKIALDSEAPLEGLAQIDSIVWDYFDFDPNDDFNHYDGQVIDRKFSRLLRLILEMDKVQRDTEASFNDDTAPSTLALARLEQNIIRLAKEWVASDGCGK